MSKNMQDADAPDAAKLPSDDISAIDLESERKFFCK